MGTLELYPRRPGLDRSRSELATFIPRRHRRVDGRYAYNDDWDNLDDDPALPHNNLWFDDGWSPGGSVRSPRSSIVSNSLLALAFSDPAWSTADVFGSSSSRTLRTTTTVPIPRWSRNVPAFGDDEVYIFPKKMTAVRVRMGGDGKPFVARMGDIKALELLERVRPSDCKLDDLSLWIRQRDSRSAPIRVKDEHRIPDLIRDYGGPESMELVVAAKHQRERVVYETTRGATDGSRGWRWETV
ncbi:hypothetical protein H2203_002463 [Taxawa tesnikishii (nom. ined.)]|nr:hypothetical protein H2203_002463 [Dothideales sp. JES 119]